MDNFRGNVDLSMSQRVYEAQVAEIGSEWPETPLGSCSTGFGFDPDAQMLYVPPPYADEEVPFNQYSHYETAGLPTEDYGQPEE